MRNSLVGEMPSELRAVYARAIVLSLATAALLLPLGIWARRIDVGPGVVPIYDPEGRSYWLAGLIVAVISAVLFQIFDRDQALSLPAAIERQVRYDASAELPTAWMFPGLTTLSVVMLMAVYHTVTAIVACVMVGFLALAIGGITRHHLYDTDATIRLRVRGIYTLLIHAVAFVALSMVYINKVRSLFSATTVLLLSIVLLLQLTEGEDALFSRRLVYALMGGVMLGQVTWVLNYWKATGWTGGAALLIFFYFAAGLIMSQLRDGVQLRDLLEYGLVSVAALFIVIFSLLA